MVVPVSSSRSISGVVFGGGLVGRTWLRRGCSVAVVWGALGCFAALSSAQPFIRGDANGDGAVDDADAIAIVNYLFAGGIIPPPIDRADVNDNEFVTLTDSFLLTAFLFCAPSPPIPPPFPAAGLDPDEDERGLAAVAPGYAVNFLPGLVTPGLMEILVTVDTPEPLKVVEFTLLLDPVLSAQSRAFSPAPTVSSTTAVEALDGSLFHLVVGEATCNEPLLPAGNSVPLGRLLFTHNGPVSACPTILPVTWIPDTVVSGVRRRAMLATILHEDHHPGAVLTTDNFIRGDANDDGIVSVADAAKIFDHVINGAAIASPIDRADANDNEFLTMTDALMVTGALFCAGAPPIPPPNTCGPDPSDNQRAFGTVQPGYVVNISAGQIDSTTLELVVTVDTPIALSAVNLTLALDASLVPGASAFFPSVGIAATTVDEFVDGNLYSVSIRNEECDNLLISPGVDQPIGTITFDQDGSIVPCPAALPVAWVPQATVGGIVRRASLVGTPYVEFHPDFTLAGCSADFIRGDANNDDTVDDADAIFVYNYIFGNGPAPRDCNGSPLFDSADINDNEWLTIADPTYLTDYLFCGAPPIPGPSACGPDPTDSQQGFDTVDNDFGQSAFVDYTLFKVEAMLRVRVAPGSVTHAATFVLEFDPSVLTPQTGPLFCAAPGVSTAGAFVEGNRVIVNVSGLGCMPLPLPVTTNGIITVGTVHFFHGAGLGCAAAVDALTLIPEAQTALAGGFTFRATVVDGNYTDHHPALAAFECKESIEDFIRGDADANGFFNGLIDGLYVLDFVFNQGPRPPCLDAADADDDGLINGLIDGLHILNHQFSGGIAPPPPYPGCGPDSTPDDACNELGCNSHDC